MEKHEIKTRFTYHPPEGDQWFKYQEIRNAAKEFAELLNTFCPQSREKSLAVRKLEESVMWANASIARRE